MDLSLIRLQLDGDRIVGEERLLKDLNARIRDVRVGRTASFTCSPMPLTASCCR